jgi:hypothetical protein
MIDHLAKGQSPDRLRLSEVAVPDTRVTRCRLSPSARATEARCAPPSMGFGRGVAQRWRTCFGSRRGRSGGARAPLGTNPRAAKVPVIVRFANGSLRHYPSLTAVPASARERLLVLEAPSGVVSAALVVAPQSVGSTSIDPEEALPRYHQPFDHDAARRAARAVRVAAERLRRGGMRTEAYSSASAKSSSSGTGPRS